MCRVCCSCFCEPGNRYKRYCANVFEGREHFSKLTRYAVTSPDRLPTIGIYFQKRIKKEISKLNVRSLLLGIECLKELIHACHTDLSLFFPYLMHIQRLVLNTPIVPLLEQSVEMFALLAQYGVHAGPLAVQQMLEFVEPLGRLANPAHDRGDLVTFANNAADRKKAAPEPSVDPRLLNLRLRATGLQGLTSLLRAAEGQIGPYLLDTVGPALFDNLARFDMARYTAQPGVPLALHEPAMNFPAEQGAGSREPRVVPPMQLPPPSASTSAPPLSPLPSPPQQEMHAMPLPSTHTHTSAVQDHEEMKQRVAGLTRLLLRQLMTLSDTVLLDRTVAALHEFLGRTNRWIPYGPPAFLAASLATYVKPQHVLQLLSRIGEWINAADSPVQKRAAVHALGAALHNAQTPTHHAALPALPAQLTASLVPALVDSLKRWRNIYENEALLSVDLIRMMGMLAERTAEVRPPFDFYSAVFDAMLQYDTAEGWAFANEGLIACALRIACSSPLRLTPDSHKLPFFSRMLCMIESTHYPQAKVGAFLSTLIAPLAWDPLALPYVAKHFVSESLFFAENTENQIRSIVLAELAKHSVPAKEPRDFRAAIALPEGLVPFISDQGSAPDTTLSTSPAPQQTLEEQPSDPRCAPPQLTRRRSRGFTRLSELMPHDLETQVDSLAASVFSAFFRGVVESLTTQSATPSNDLTSTATLMQALGHTCMALLHRYTWFALSPLLRFLSALQTAILGSNMRHRAVLGVCVGMGEILCVMGRVAGCNGLADIVEPTIEALAVYPSNSQDPIPCYDFNQILACLRDSVSQETSPAVQPLPNGRWELTTTPAAREKCLAALSAANALEFMPMAPQPWTLPPLPVILPLTAPVAEPAAQEPSSPTLEERPLPSVMDLFDSEAPDPWVADLVHGSQPAPLGLSEPGSLEAASAWWHAEGPTPTEGPDSAQEARHEAELGWNAALESYRQAVQAGEDRREDQVPSELPATTPAASPDDHLTSALDMLTSSTSFV